MGKCSHKDLINDVIPKSEGCADCIEKGDGWVHLRICKICGYVGCCDSSKNKHARKHFEETGHMLIQSFEEGEDWYWCYLDETFFRIKGE